jgi:hypothetical protein
MLVRLRRRHAAHALRPFVYFAAVELHSDFGMIAAAKFTEAIRTVMKCPSPRVLA